MLKLAPTRIFLCLLWLFSPIPEAGNYLGQEIQSQGLFYHFWPRVKGKKRNQEAPKLCQRSEGKPLLRSSLHCRPANANIFLENSIPVSEICILPSWIWEFGGNAGGVFTLGTK